jgi:hypothetical protein
VVRVRVHVGGWDLKASDPVRFHRGWPGVGPTHSLLFGVVISFLVWRLLGSKTWAISFLIGQWAHAITDTGDTAGTMLSSRGPCTSTSGRGRTPGRRAA